MKYEDANDVIPALKRAGVKFGHEVNEVTKKAINTISWWGQLGIKNLGRVDFLIHHQGYRRVRA